MPEQTHTVDEVFGVSRDLPLNYVTRPNVDGKLFDNLSRGSHLVIYGSSKQGKTSLRKYCLKEEDYDVVSCQNRWTLAEAHSAILKEVGYSVRQSTARTVTGANKITATFQAKGSLPFVAHAKGTGSVERQQTEASTDTRAPLELDPSDVNDIIRAMNEIKYEQFMVLEDFHYLPGRHKRTWPSR